MGGLVNEVGGLLSAEEAVKKTKISGSVASYWIPLGCVFPDFGVVRKYNARAS